MFNRFQFVRVSILSLFAAGVAVVLSGCGDSGPRMHKVTGDVTFDGTPIEDGQITFKRVSDSKAYSGEIKNGSYEVKCEDGEMAVEINATRVVPGKFDTTSNPGHKEPVIETYIPKIYNTATTLKVKVDSGSTSHSFDLKK